MEYIVPRGHFKMQDVLHKGEHVFIHFFGKFPNRQQNVLHIHVGRIVLQDHSSGSGAHSLLMNLTILVVNPVQGLLHLLEDIPPYHTHGVLKLML